MRVPGLKTSKLFARWVRSRFVEHGLILGYHRVVDKRQDPFSMSISPENFTEHLKVLHRFARPASLLELVEGLKNGNLPKNTVVVTFDDGYTDVLDTAMPLLQKYDVPATVFLATGYLGRHFWWDDLATRILNSASLPDNLMISIGDKTVSWSHGEFTNGEQSNGKPGKGNSDSRLSLIHSLYREFLPMSPGERDIGLEQLFRRIGSPAPLKPDAVLNPEEVIRLAHNSGIIAVGAHSVTHPLMTNQSIGDQRFEIQQSKQDLEDLLNQEVKCYSYSNGDAPPTARAIVRQSGYQCACASFNDMAWKGNDMFLLPRFWPPDWDGETFERWLRRWLVTSK